MDRQWINGLPKQCLFLNANGEVMHIEYGKDGLRRSELNTENRAANREIVNGYNERHGVTHEQVRKMRDCALVGWNTIPAPASPMGREYGGKDGRVFEVELSAAHTGFATLALPAAPFVLLDALDRAHIDQDKDSPYTLELLDSKLDYLPQFITPNADIHELNHLTQRLAEMDQWQLGCFEGMVMMDAVRTEYTPIPLDRLINMTHSMEECQVVCEAHDDETLGRFYVDNDFPVLPCELPEALYELLDYEAIGRKARMDEGGVFTPQGYVVHNGEIARIYKSGDAVPRDKSHYTVMLEVRKGCFNGPDCDNNLTATLKLPANDSDLDRAADAVEAASENKCVFTAVDCIVPALTGRITDALQDDFGSYGTVNELAEQLKRLEQKSLLTTYKAMLAAAPGDITLTEALELSYETEGFLLSRELLSPADYAGELLRKHGVPMPEALSGAANLHLYGKQLMREHLVTDTPYGLLRPADGQTVEQILDRPSQSQGMEMQ